MITDYDLADKINLKELWFTCVKLSWMCCNFIQLSEEYRMQYQEDMNHARKQLQVRQTVRNNYQT